MKMKGQNDDNRPPEVHINDGVDLESLDDGASASYDDVNSLDLTKMSLSDLASIDFDSIDDIDLPNRLIVTNVEESVFDHDELRCGFEDLFKKFDLDATFCYLKSFRRAHVTFSTITATVRARIELDNLLVGAKRIKCYFAQTVPQPNLVTDPFLMPPKPVKQFLISPPPSPPEGWEPIEEHHPVPMDYDLLAAIAKLAPGEAHVLHPSEDNLPSIVVHICEDPDGFNDPTKPKIEQTRHPSAY